MGEWAGSRSCLRMRGSKIGRACGKKRFQMHERSTSALEFACGLRIARAVAAARWVLARKAAVPATRMEQRVDAQEEEQQRGRESKFAMHGMVWARGAVRSGSGLRIG